MGKTAGILYEAEFKSSAMYAKKYLKTKKMNVLSMLFKKNSTIANLPKFGTAIDLMVWYSHGGWDGPMVFLDLKTNPPLQISPSEPIEWVQLMTYFKLQMKPKGVFITHSCHAAGSDRWEIKRDKRLGLKKDNRIWVRDVAKNMNVFAMGQAGWAGVRNLPTVKKMLDFTFTGNAKGYPFKAYAPGGVRIINKANWPKL